MKYESYIMPKTFVNYNELNTNVSKAHLESTPFKIPNINVPNINVNNNLKNSKEIFAQLNNGNNTVRNNIINNTNSISDIGINENIISMARKITQSFEGGQIAGNFDGQGLSLGFLQWNIGSGTLQPLLNRMSTENVQEYREIFSKRVDADNVNGGKPMWEILDEVLKMDKDSQLTWAKSINSNNKIIEPWKSAFEKLVNNNSFSKIQEDAAGRYYKTANNIVNDKEIGVKTNRGYALAFDIAVQNGSVKKVAKELVVDALNGKQNKLTNEYDQSLTTNQRYVIKDLNNRLKGVTDEDTKKLYYTAAAVAISSNDRFVKDVWSRKSAIVNGTGVVHGKSYNLAQQVGLNDISLA